MRRPRVQRRRFRAAISTSGSSGTVLPRWTWTWTSLLCLVEARHEEPVRPVPVRHEREPRLVGAERERARPLLAEERRDGRGPEPHLARREVGDLVILGRADGAGRVNEPPAGPDEGGEAPDEVALERGEAGQVLELRLRLRPRRDGARAQVVDPRAARAAARLVEPLGVGVERVERALVVHLGRERERLSARARARVHHGEARAGAAGERDELAPLVLDLEAPLLEGGKGERVLASVEDEPPRR